MGAGLEPLGGCNPEAAKKTEAQRDFLPQRFLEPNTLAPVRAGPEKAEGPFRVGPSPTHLPEYLEMVCHICFSLLKILLN